MKKYVILTIVFSVVVLLSGCARYKVGGETFYSSSDALKKQTEIRSNILNGISPAENPVHATALILIPSDAEIMKNHIRFSNNPSQFNKEQIDWLITSIRNNCEFMADAIKKRGVFDTVSVVRHDGNPASFSIGNYDFTVSFDVDGWSIKTKDNPKPFPLPIDNSKPVGALRVLSFLEDLHQQARLLGRP